MRRILPVFLALGVLMAAAPRGLWAPEEEAVAVRGITRPTSAEVDTTKLLVRHQSLPNTAADDSTYDDGTPWIRADGYYDTITEGDAGAAVRWATVRTSTPTVPWWEINGPRMGRLLDEDNQGVTPYGMFVAFKVGTPTGKVERAHILINAQLFQDFNFSAGGYVVARLDTVVADYSMVLTGSGDTTDGSDLGWMNTSFNQVNVDLAEAWSPTLATRDDTHDFGPRGEPFSASYDVLRTNAMNLDVTWPVQLGIDSGLFEQTAGWAIFHIYAIDMTTSNYATMASDDAGRATKGNPAFELVTSSRRGAKDWGTTNVPVVFGADDGFDDHAWMADLLTGNGHPYVEYAPGNGFVHSIPLGQMSAEQADSIMANPLVDLIMHSRDHDGTATLTLHEMDYQMARDWLFYRFTAPRDTTTLRYYAWPGAGGDPNTYSIRGIDRMIANNYQGARATTTTWSDSTGQMTFLGLDNYVNLYVVAPIGAQTIFGTSATPFTEAQIKEALTTQIDLMVTDYGRSALIIYAHSPDYDGANYPNVEYFRDLIESIPNVDFKSFTEVMDWRLRGAEFVAPGDVTVANGATLQNETAAAMYDSVKTADSNARMDSVWVAPLGQ